MSAGSWDAMLADEQRQKEAEQVQSRLARCRELSRLSKAELIALIVTTEHEIGRQSNG